MKKIIAVTLSLVSINASAYTKTAEFGIRMNHAINDIVSSKDKLTFQGGVIIGLPLNENVTFRTGGILAIKDSELDGTTSGVSVNVKTNHLFLDIPATMQIGNDSIQGYAGFNLGLKLSSSCSGSVGGISGNSCKDEKSLVLQPIIGGNYLISSNTKIGAFYELEAEYFKTLKQSALGIHVGFDF